ncbi:MAG TPA: glycerophosphodiester phosphodiesterase family protein [Gemmatimonadaceae bacterium]|nr:glycerophosphodiester phosphodiesterase family protein [Gemmatimonadaceae bacterium]
MSVLLEPDAHPVIAHRGNSAHAPENTLAAFDQALAAGADALELDVRLTRDGAVVVLHDPDLVRTTGVQGLVGEMDLAAVELLDAGARFTPDGGRSFPYRGTGLKVPLLEEVLERYAQTPLIIEPKAPEVLQPLRQLLERHAALDRTLVDAALDAAVLPLRGGSVATGASMREVARLLARSCLPKMPSRLPYRALCIPLSYQGMPVPAAWLARRTRAAGVVTHVWTIDDPVVAARLWRAGVQGIITNDPARMLRAREELYRTRMMPGA